MIAPILACLAVFVVQTLLPAQLRLAAWRATAAEKARFSLGPRDAPPPATLSSDRAQRALANMHEALPVFLALALLHHVSGDPSAQVVTAAWVFVAARAVYVVACVAVPAMGVRSAVWTVGVGALLAMAAPLLG